MGITKWLKQIENICFNMAGSKKCHMLHSIVFCKKANEKLDFLLVKQM